MGFEISTISDGILKRSQIAASLPVFQYKDPARWREATWTEVIHRMGTIAGGLQSQGVKKGQSVGLLSNTRVEWALIDFSLQVIGAVTVPVYPSLLPDEIQFILNNSDAVGIFVEDRGQLEKIYEIWKHCPHLKWVVALDNSIETLQHECGTIYGLETFERQKTLSRSEMEREAAKISKHDLASIIYTSGTTGQPKGVRLTHDNFVRIGKNSYFVGLSEKDVSLAFLPMSHIFGRTELYAVVFLGTRMCFARGIQTISEDLPIGKPTFLMCVPRIYEKVYAKIKAGVEASPPTKQKIFNWALGIGGQVSVLRERQEPIPLWLGIQYRIADRLVFSKIAQKFGGRLRMAMSAGAPLSESIARFFHSCGILILEAYGLTETTGPFTCNHPTNYRFGTVGLVYDESEMKFDSDGEILVRGPSVFSAYHKNPEQTKKEFTEGGWYRTGDIGVLEDGFLKITDRKKDLIVTAGGKNVAPQYIENLLKLEPGISQVVVLGDRQKYLAALVTVDRQHFESMAKAESIPYETWSELVRHPRIAGAVEESLKHVNAKLPSYSTIKKFKILENDFSVETGELTPSMKVRRKVCAQKFKTEIDSLFVG